ncbi:MAG: hypothetical protein P8Z76_11120 [Alphaproteobacteria bacterium]
MLLHEHRTLGLEGGELASHDVHPVFGFVEPGLRGRTRAAQPPDAGELERGQRLLRLRGADLRIDGGDLERQLLVAHQGEPVVRPDRGALVDGEPADDAADAGAGDRDVTALDRREYGLAVLDRPVDDRIGFLRGRGLGTDAQRPRHHHRMHQPH